MPPPKIWTQEQFRHFQATGEEPQTETPPSLAEHQLLAHVRRLAHEHGWLVYHTHDSRRSDEGFPDLCLCKPQQPVIFAELKTRTGKPTMPQAHWLAFLQRATGVEAYLWRPADLASIYMRLRA